MFVLLFNIVSQAQINLTKQIYEKQIQRSKAIQALKEKEYIPYESRQQSMSVNQGTDRISKQKQDTQKQGTQKQGTQKQGKNELKNGRTKEEGPNWHQKERRSKQILIGKNTDGYIRYKAAIPIDQRQFYDGHQSIGGRICPQTPRADEATTKRQWDAKTQQWRRELHMWDDFENSKCMSFHKLNSIYFLFGNNLHIYNIILLFAIGLRIRFHAIANL